MTAVTPTLVMSIDVEAKGTVLQHRHSPKNRSQGRRPSCEPAPQSGKPQRKDGSLQSSAGQHPTYRICRPETPQICKKKISILHLQPQSNQTYSRAGSINVDRSSKVAGKDRTPSLDASQIETS